MFLLHLFTLASTSLLAALQPRRHRTLPVGPPALLTHTTSSKSVFSPDILDPCAVARQRVLCELLCVVNETMAYLYLLVCV